VLKTLVVRNPDALDAPGVTKRIIALKLSASRVAVRCEKKLWMRQS
jgi:hypothetical protein